MNKNSVTSRLRNKSKETGVNYQTLQAFFFYESFLNLLAESPYNENFILKGGLLVSALTGIINRGTVDIDFLMRNQQMNEDTISKIITAVTASADTDSVYFELNKIEPIRENDEYGGLRAHLCGRLANIRQPFYIDIATGDPVTPEAEILDYHTIFGEIIRIKSYPIETILTEKLQTILVLADANGRSKDFYDIYILSKLEKSEIRTDQFHTAVQRTFEYRKSSLPDEYDALHIIDRIQNDASCNRRWSLYAKKSPYAAGVSFEDTTTACKQLLKQLYSYNGRKQ
ncbi:MAG: nucleotidyl transferase AbiEii/AbiGii toxin family protein [Treponema sp.]